MTIFTPLEWVRLLCYTVAMPSLVYLAMRAAKRHDWTLAMFYAGFALLFGWYLTDLTLLSAGLSSRETRSFGTPITLLATGSVVVLLVREARQHRREHNIRAEIEEIERGMML